MTNDEWVAELEERIILLEANHAMVQKNIDRINGKGHAKPNLAKFLKINLFWGLIRLER